MSYERLVRKTGKKKWKQQGAPDTIDILFRIMCVLGVLVVVLSSVLVVLSILSAILQIHGM